MLRVPVYLIWLLTSASGFASAAAAADTVDELAALDRAFATQLEALALRCDELELGEQAASTRTWRIPRTPGRHLLFFPPATDPLKPDDDATQVIRFWHEHLSGMRRAHAARLYTLAESSAEAGDETTAYRLLHEVLREDPDHAEARGALGYRQGSRGWTLPERQPRARPGRSSHPVFGWPRNAHWTVRTEHFEITTNHSARAGLELGEWLERVHAAWQQMFYSYWAVPGRLARRMAGETSSLGPDRTFDVVLFRDRENYIEELQRVETRIAGTVGYYDQASKTAYFYVGEEDNLQVFAHEAAHQFFHEMNHATDSVGEEEHFWIVEGLALYVESLQLRDGYAILGGFEADRLQYARYRALNEGFYVPLAELVTYGRRRVQEDADIRKLYSQAAGLAHYFLDGRAERQAELMAYVREVYEGKAAPVALAALTGTSHQILDEGYLEFLQVGDDDLAHLPAGTRLRNLCLTHCAVTDNGLRALRDQDQLEWLDLSFTGIGDDGLAHVVASAPTLRQLNLEATGVTDASAGFLAACNGLEELDLSSTGVGNPALESIGTLRNLKVLWLTNTDVSDQGMEALTGCRRLEVLDLTNTSVTDDAARRLRSQLPLLPAGGE